MYGGKRDRTGGVAVEAHPPASFAQVLEQLDRTVPLARAQLAGRARQRLPDLAADRFEQQDLPARMLDRDARRNDPRVVHDRQGLEQSGQLAKRRDGTRSPVARRKTSSRDSSRCVAGCCAISSSGKS